MQTFDHMIGGDRAIFHLQRYKEKMLIHDSDVGFDLYPMAVQKTEYLGSWVQIFVQTGIHVIMPQRIAGIIVGRSSSVSKLCGASVELGVIDPGYTGEWMVRLKTLRTDREEVMDAIMEYTTKGVAIAQFLAMKIVHPHFIEWDPTIADRHKRGAKGWGSTDNSPLADPVPPTTLR